MKIGRTTIRVWHVAAGTVLGLVLAIAFSAGVLVAPYMDFILIQRAAPLPPFGEAWLWVERQFYGAVPPTDVRMRGAIRGMLATLDDPYTVLLDPQPAQQERQRLAGTYGDVGVSLWWAEEGHVALAPYPSGPAARAGVQPGDLLTGIDGEPLQDIERLEDVAWRLQGAVGTVVGLDLLRSEGEVLHIPVTREEILHPSIESRDLTPDVGYVKINSFTDQTAREVRDLLDTWTQGPAPSALILDLRGNAGGVLSPLPSLGGALLGADLVMYIDTDRDSEHIVKTSGAQLFAGPLAVLVDGGTASAAEILAAALADHGRAVLIGAPTYGKGSVQALYPLPDGSVMHITHAVWLTPDGNRLDGAGLQPDFTVGVVAGRDAALKVALEHIAVHTP